MKATIIKQFGAAEVMHLEEVTEPKAVAREIVLEPGKD